MAAFKAATFRAATCMTSDRKQTEENKNSYIPQEKLDKAEVFLLGWENG